MTTKGEWKVYTGSDEQIAECDNSKSGFMVRYRDTTESPILHNCFPAFDFEITHYWIIPDDPLADMICQQAQTGQPVWVRMTERSYWINNLGGYEGKQQKDGNVVIVTIMPNWNIPNAEYSFTPFED